MKTRICIAAAILALAAFSSADGQSARERMLVDAAWLKQHIGDDHLVLLHVGDESEYGREHIPGARFIRLDDLAAPMDHSNMKPGQLMLELPTPEAARARLEALGISDGSRIVVYYGNDWVTPSTRIVFDLDWIGLGDRTSLLDGGMQAWKRSGGAVTDEPPVVRAGKLTPKPARQVVVDYAFVYSHLSDPKYLIVDGRSPASYDGVSGRRTRPGHIRGAVNIPYSQIADDALNIESAARLTEFFQKAGYRRGQTIIAYCHLGQQATAVVFAARTLGYNAVLYDGSYDDWEAHADSPIEKTGGR